MQGRRKLKKFLSCFIPALTSTCVARIKSRGSVEKKALNACNIKCRRAGNLSSVVMYVLSIFLIAGTITGCSMESAATKPSESGGGYFNAQVSNENSDVGSLESAPDSLNEADVIRPGDKIQITVWGYPEFNTTTTVKGYGTITVPLIGEIIAAGLTVHELSTELKQRLSEYVKGKVKLTISHIGMNKQVSVMGAVNRQGNYPALRELSLIEVLGDAGGTAANADLRRIKIFRRGATTDAITVDLMRYLRNGDIQYIPKVGPGDTVFVPKQADFVKAFSRYANEVVLLFGFFALLR